MNNILCIYYNNYNLAYFNKRFYEMQKNVESVTLQKFLDKFRITIHYK
jgi:hypothetical protein